MRARPEPGQGMPAILHFYPALLSLLALAAIASGDAWPLAMLAWLFYGQALLEALMGNRFRGRPGGPRGEEAFSTGKFLTGKFLTGALLLTLPLQLAILGLGLWRVAVLPATPLELVGTVLLMGVTSGSFGITVAHELVHRRAAWQRGVGVALLLLVHIPHFRIEHVHNHHAHVGTPRDPATARLGESLYRFFPRSLAGQFLGAWRLERDRRRRRGLPPLGPGNRMLTYLALQVLLDLAVLLAFGWVGLGAFLLQGLVAVWLLESVNYIEHYGLARRPLSDGGFEPLTERHSWNAGHAVTNAALFNLGMHSAHHLEAARPFPLLYNRREMPQLPTGYAGAVLLAMLPPLWHRIMDPRARAFAERAAG